MSPIIPLALSLLLASSTALQDKPSTVSPSDIVSALETAVADAIERAQPSVVAINRIKSEDGQTTAIRGRIELRNRGNMLVFGQNDADPLSKDYVAFDYGSGVVIGDEGQILTNYHLVEGAARLIVRAQGVDPFEAEILAADPRSDLAVIAPVLPQMDDNGRPRLRPLPIGDASNLRQGSFLVALGNPFNVARDGQSSASFGILANRARSLIIPPSPDGISTPTPQLQHLATLFQLDSKLNLGMSGGAVVDMKGELVALTTASANAIGYDPRAGYAVPMDTLGRRIVESLKKGEEVEYGFLGIRLPSGSNLISEVQPGTPAAEGDLIAGDQIIEVNGLLVKDFDGLILAVNASPVGEPVELRIRRGNGELKKTVILSKFPIDDGEIIATNRPDPWRGLRIDFSSVLAFGELEVMARGGVAVVEVLSGTPAEVARVRVGSIIRAVEGQPIRNPREFREAVAEHEGQPVKLETDLGPLTIEPQRRPASDRDD
ncbi:DegQ family serine endoprotease [soil metagenome]